MKLTVERVNSNPIVGLSLSGCTLTVPLYLNHDPVQNMEAATKQYVDNKKLNLNASNFITGTIAAARLPAFTGDVTSSAGSTTFTLANSGVTAGTYPKVTVNAKGIITAGASLSASDIPNLDWSKITTGKPTTLAGYGITDALSINGGTMTGALTLNANPTNPGHLATKQYTDNAINTNLNSLRVGNIIEYPNPNTPSGGFLRCNGALVSQTTYSALYAVIGDTFTPSVTSVSSGKPWKQQYRFNAVQSGNISVWTNPGNIPSGLTLAQAFITKNKAYILGGVDAAGVKSTIYMSTIDATGTLGSWSSVGSLPINLCASQAVFTKNRVYLIGGHDGTNYVNSVYTAQINSDGTLGSWTTGPSLPVAIGYTQVIATSSKVYVLGGSDSTTIRDTVYVANINSDGTLGSWSTASNLYAPLRYSQAIVTNNRVYLLGGQSTSANGDYTNSIYTTTINPDGTLNSWSFAGTLPDKIAFSQVVVTGNTVYLVGGVKSI
jgi:hypothetical protein